MSKQGISSLVGSRTLSFILLAVMLTVLLLGLQFFQQYQHKRLTTETTAFQQQRFAAIEAGLQQAVSRQQARLVALAGSPELARILSSADKAALENWQASSKQFFPDVEKLCVLETLPEAPGNDGCLDITYLTLDSLRQLQETPQSDIAMLMPGSDKAHLLLAQRLDSADAGFQALVMTVNAAWLDQQVNDKLVSDGYLEISQGNQAATKLTGFGNPQFKLDKPAFSAAIPNTYWTLQYWPEQKAVMPGASLMMFILGLVLVILWC
ncbi:MAG: hypothetical protein HUJ23_00480, partial [Methylophaga sp.]|nr:hypothetical protein [Methylophaga sp.]